MNHRRAPCCRIVIAALAALFLSATAARAAELELTADLSTRKLTVLEGSKAVATYDISVGSPEHPTPTGTFQIRRIIWNPDWVPPNEEWAEGEEPKGPTDPDNPMKTVTIFFDEPDYYIHGTDATGSLGEAASHGCLRMARWEAAKVAQALMNAAGEAKPQSWYDETLEKDIQREVTLDRAITLKITE